MKRRFQFSLLTVMRTVLASALFFALVNAVLDARERAHATTLVTNNVRVLNHTCRGDGTCPICLEIANR